MVEVIDPLRVGEMQVLIPKLEDEIKRLEKEVGFWMGEGQEDRPEMIEYHSLVELTTRTSEQTQRLIEIANQIRMENEDEPKLRKEIKRLTEQLQEIEEGDGLAQDEIKDLENTILRLMKKVINEEQLTEEERRKYEILREKYLS